jgi:hypothetical protein
MIGYLPRFAIQIKIRRRKMKRMTTKIRWGGLVLLAALLVAGCETAVMDNQGEVSLAQLQGITEPVAETPDGGDTGGGTPAPDTGGGTPTTDGSWPSEIDGPIKWLNTSVSDWPVTSSLRASVGGGTISMPYDKAKAWPSVGGLNANPWVIVKMEGQWYAATFEWLRYGQTSKPVGVLNGALGDHIKVSPLNRWRPRSGERFGIMVSGLVRAQSRNVRERTNVSMVTWP